MADIRINALATTAASTASDDFIAVDGSANGTRKLNAYSPTFGGNVTASGNLTVSGIGTIGNTGNTTGNDSLKLGGKAISDGSGLYGNYGSLILNSDASFTANANPYLITNALNATSFAIIRGANATTVPTLGTNGAVTSGTVALSISNAGNTTLAGNLTVSNSITSAASSALVLRGDNATGGILTLNLSGTSTADFTQGNGRVVTTNTNSPEFRASRSSVIAALGVDATGGYVGTLTAAKSLSLYANGTVAATLSATNGNLLIGTTNDAPNARLHVLGANNAGLRIDQGSYNYYSAYEHIFQAVNFGTIYGKFANNGSLILKSDGVDSGNGKLQLASHTSYTGGIGFGTDISLYRDSANYLAIQTSTSTSGFHFYEGASMKGGISTTSGSMYLATYSATSILLQTNGTTALTLDSSQNATFAGTVTLPNDKAIYFKEVGGTAQRFALNSGDVIYIEPDQLHKISIGGAGVTNVGAGGIGVAGNSVFSGTVRSNTQEGFKIAAASGYFAGYEADGTTLNGYLQFINSVGTLLNQSIAGKNIALAIAGTPQLTLTTGDATFAGTVTATGNITSSGGAANLISVYRTTDGQYFKGGGGNAARSLTMTSAQTTAEGDTHIIDAPSGTGVLKFQTTSVDRLTIASNGNVTLSGNLTVSGTGTSSIGGEPSTGLATYSGNLRIQSAGNGPATVNGIELQNSQSGSGYGYKIYTNNSNDYIGIAGRLNSATWTEFLAIKQNTGNLLIGTTTDGGQKLQVNGVIAAGTTGGDRITLSAVSATDQYFLAQNYWNDNGTENVATSARGSWRAVMRNATSNTFNIDWRAANAAAGTFTNLLSLDSSGNATFAGTVTAGTWASGNADKLKVSTSANAYAAYIVNTAASGGSYGIRLHTDATAATDLLLVATSGSGGGSTRFTVKANGTLNAPSLPTSSAGLSTGDIWNDAGTLKIVP